MLLVKQCAIKIVCVTICILVAGKQMSSLRLQVGDMCHSLTDKYIDRAEERTFERKSLWRKLNF